MRVIIVRLIAIAFYLFIGGLLLIPFGYLVAWILFGISVDDGLARRLVVAFMLGLLIFVFSAAAVGVKRFSDDVIGK